MKTVLPPFVHGFPAPAVLIGCGSLEKPNLITCSWFGTVCSEPPMVGLAVRESRYSYHLIQQHRAFSVNIPCVSDLKAVVHCGTVSGRRHDKFRELGLTAVPCPPLKDTPMIAEFHLSLACRVRHELELGSHHLFVAEVLAVHGEEIPAHAANRPHLHADEQITYLDGKYWALHEVALAHDR
ncbi:MAG: flavin reductase family protein [bacterium]|nr:flavin reductase family protein [bacterium]